MNKTETTTDVPGSLRANSVWMLVEIWLVSIAQRRKHTSGIAMKQSQFTFPFSYFLIFFCKGPLYVDQRCLTSYRTTTCTTQTSYTHLPLYFALGSNWCILVPVDNIVFNESIKMYPSMSMSLCGCLICNNCLIALLDCIGWLNDLLINSFCLIPEIQTMIMVTGVV